jgi:MYXO-CTERM domain-containing protein
MCEPSLNCTDRNNAGADTGEEDSHMHNRESSSIRTSLLALCITAAPGMLAGAQTGATGTSGAGQNTPAATAPTRATTAGTATGTMTGSGSNLSPGVPTGSTAGAGMQGTAGTTGIPGTPGTPAPGTPGAGVATPGTVGAPGGAPGTVGGADSGTAAGTGVVAADSSRTQAGTYDQPTNGGQASNWGWLGLFGLLGLLGLRRRAPDVIDRTTTQYAPPEVTTR